MLQLSQCLSLAAPNSGCGCEGTKFDRAARLCKITPYQSVQRHPLGSRDWEGLGESWGQGAAPTPHLHAGSPYCPTQPMRLQTIPPEVAAAAHFGFEFLHSKGTFTRISPEYFTKLKNTCTL